MNPLATHILTGSVLDGETVSVTIADSLHTTGEKDLVVIPNHSEDGDTSDDNSDDDTKGGSEEIRRL